MKLSNSLMTVFIVGVVLFSAGFVCSGDSDSGAANGTTGKTNSTNAPNSGPPTKGSIDLKGNYDTTGTNPNGGAPYKASLVVTPHDDVYQFSWTLGSSSYDGVGVLTESTVAVSYTDGPNGKGCGVVLYKIGSDGSLDGKSGYWGVNKGETEKATRTSGTDLDGKYDISGKNPDGKDYKGTLEVAKAGEGYAFKWNVGGGAALEGFGIKTGDKAAVGFGGKQCSFVAYDVAADGTLNGKWGNQATKAFGTETAKKK